MKLCILMFCVVLVASFPLHAQFAYSRNPDGTVTITNYTGPEGPLQIPQNLERMRVTAIGSTAFKASRVTSVTIPDSVLEIGPEAFSECPLLRDVSIGSGLTYLSDNPFLGCASLTNILVDSRNRFFSCTDGVLIKKEQKQIVAYPSGREGTYLVPEDVTSTSYDAFKGCARLSGFIGSDSIVSIGSFSDCTALTNVVLGNNVEYIPYEGFMRCRALKGFDIPDSVSSIEPRTFAGCSSLERLVIGRNMTNIPSCGFGRRFCALAGCYSLTNFSVHPENPVFVSDHGVLLRKEPSAVVKCPAAWSGDFAVPAGVTTIERGAFSGCARLTGVVLAQETMIIEDSAFYQCSALESVTWPDTLNLIGSSAFVGCYALTSIKLPNAIVQLGDGVFQDCSRLTDADLGNGINVIPPSTFAGCRSLRRLIFGKLREVGDSAFSRCVSLKGVSLPEGVHRIGSYAFGECLSLENIDLPTSLTDIGSEAFASCSALLNANVPALVTNIGLFAFSGTSSLTNIAVDPLNQFYLSRDGVLFSKQSVLLRCPATKMGSYRIPDGVAKIGSAAFSHCAELTDITLPESVISIENDAFAACRLTNIDVAPGNSAFISIDGVLFDNLQTTLVAFPGGRVGDYRVPESVTALDENAFSGAVGLSTVSLPAGVTGALPLFDCPSLTAIRVNPANPIYSSLDGVLFEKSGDLLLYPRGKVGNYSIPNSVNNIVDGAFYSCASLTSITIPESVRYKSPYCSIFAECTSLTNISVASANPDFSSADGVLLNKRADTLLCYPAGRAGKYVLPGTVTNIGTMAFWHCAQLTALSLPEMLSIIMPSAFASCSALDLMADGAHRVLAFRVEKSGVVAVHINAGCPDGQSRKNVLALGGVYVLIHQVNANKQPHHANYYTIPRPGCPQRLYHHRHR